MKYVILLLISANVFGMKKAINSRRLEKIVQQETEVRRKNAAPSNVEVTILQYSGTCMDQTSITTDKHIIIIDNNYEKITVFYDTFSSKNNQDRHLIISHSDESYIRFLETLDEIPFVQQRMKNLKNLKTRSLLCKASALKPLDGMIQLLRCHEIIQSISGK